MVKNEEIKEDRKEMKKTDEEEEKMEEFVIKNIGGLTLTRRVKGKWLADDEQMIPVRIACSKDMLLEIIKFTKIHYEQDKVFAYKVSDEAYIIWLDWLKKMLKIASFHRPEKCSNRKLQSFLNHIKPGDFYLYKGVPICFVCYDEEDKAELLEKINKSSGREIKRLRQERQIQLLKWETHRKEILGLVSFNLKRVEFDDAIKRIENDCSRVFDKRYSELNEQIRKEIGKIEWDLLMTQKLILL